MTERLELDRVIRDRLARLAAATPVAPAPALIAVPSKRVRPRRLALGARTPIATIAVAVVLFATLGQLGSRGTGSVLPSGSASATPPGDKGIYVVNLDSQTVEVLIDGQFQGSFECGATAEIVSALRRGAAPWSIDVRAGTSGQTMDIFSIDGPLPQGILIRDGHVLHGPWPMSFGPAPAPSCGPARMDMSKGEVQPDGSVLAVAGDGTFEVRLRSEKSSYEGGEPVDVIATVGYIGGSESLSRTFEDRVFFTGRQLDGDNRFTSQVYPASCLPKELRDLPRDWPLAGADPTGTDSAWIAHFSNGALTLPAGRWRIRASFQGSIPACSGIQHELDLSIDITVGSEAAVFPDKCSPPPGKACL